MDQNRNPEYETGRAPVGGPRPPMETLAAHGAPPRQEPPVDRMAYTSPGPPPWAAPAPPPLNIGRKRSTGFAIIAAVAGSVFVLLACLGTVALGMKTEPVPSRSIAPPPAAVTTSGTCEKKLIGEYGLIATVRATSATVKTQAGVLWVRWEVTGEAAQEFTKRATLEPGDSVELTVNEKVAAERWFRVGECSYGWTPNA
ncbi:MAG TPA: hypothetical protein VFU47_04440 [Armatimonadota bacterium]|nr:hypothetical protein [Armatimonadota bacterium]